MVSGSKLWQPFLYIKYSVINAFFFLQATFFSLLIRHSFWSRNLSLEWWCRLNVYIYAHELLFIKHLILDIEIEFVFLQSLIMDRKMINIQKHSNKAWNEPFSIGIDIHIAAIPQWMRWFSKWNHFYFIRLDFPDPKPNRWPISAQRNATQLLWYVSHIHFVYKYLHKNATICQVSACPMVHSVCRKCILQDQWHWHMFKMDWKQYLSHFLWTHVHIAFRRLY